MKNLVILISSGGSNMAALARAARQDDWERRLGARIAAVISNRPDAPGLDLARELGLPTEVIDHQRFDGREAFDAALAGAIDLHQPALVVLAGFMRILTPDFVARYAGATVHRVTADLDHGPILDQAIVPVMPDDTPESLAARVLTQEHVLYPRAIARLLRPS